MFVKNEPVVYNGMCGIISFVGSSYVVMEIPSSKGRNSARILIFHENYKDIISNRQSTK